MEDDFLRRLEAGYFARCGDSALRAAAWSGLCRRYPPSIEDCAFTEKTPPSTIFARDAGDLGIAILWIVQAALVRPIAAETGLTENHAPAPASIGALAHSENPAHPMRALIEGRSLRLSGEKKYITGGLDADFLLVTALDESGETRRIFHLPAGLLPAGALVELELGMLRTTSHARLSLTDFTLDEAFPLPADGRAVNRAIKRWGMVERALILEAYIGLCIYLVRRPDISGIMGPATAERLGRLLDEQAKSRRAQVDAAMSGERIDPRGVDIVEVARAAKHAAERAGAANLPATELARIDDLKLARLFAPRPEDR
ncbi:MAG TPA: hypothetical protein VLM75_11255 [Spirochaetota bacterium]|nr:hypothetical protein [Spirochaetota bacterium]